VELAQLLSALPGAHLQIEVCQLIGCAGQLCCCPGYSVDQVSHAAAALKRPLTVALRTGASSMVLSDVA
jgi:hypothetical protein